MLIRPKSDFKLLMQKHVGAGDVLPAGIEIVNRFGTTVTPVADGYEILKSGGVDAQFDTDAISNLSVENFILRLDPIIEGTWGGGLSVDPTVSSNYTNLVYQWVYFGGNSWGCYVYGGQVGSNIINAGPAWIWRTNYATNPNIYFGLGATFAAAQAAPFTDAITLGHTAGNSAIDEPLKFDSSLHTMGTKFKAKLSPT